MRRSSIIVLLAVLVCGLTRGVSAHIGDRIFLLFEATEADLADIDISLINS